MQIAKLNLKRPRVGQIIFGVIAFVLAITLFIFVRNFTACWTLTSLPGMAPKTCGTTQNSGPVQEPAVNEEGTPIATQPAPTQEISAPDVQLPPEWDGASRVNILILGLDYSDWRAEDGAPRSDTMILLTIDPISRTAGMLSIPRDLWVNVPGSGYGKINTAYSIGEGSKLPGGGPALASLAVEQFLGVPVDYYAQVDFYVFVRLIDEIGGVKIQIDEPIEVDLIGDIFKSRTLEPGRYTLDGEWALAYARARHTKGGDVDRSKRQQQVILAIRDRLLEPGNLPRVISKAPVLYEEVSSGIRTNMSLDMALRLAMLALDIPVEDIKRGVLSFEDNMIIPTKSPDGLDILKPIYENIRILRDDIFTTSGALSPYAQGDYLELAKQEGATIHVLNATYSADIAQTTGQYLISQGLNVTGAGNASSVYSRSVIVLHNSRLYTLRYLTNLFRADAGAQLVIKYDPSAVADIEIYIGDDWVASNPMP